MAEHEQPRSVFILYRNWRDQTAWRRVTPKSISFEATVHHPEPQWLLHALDVGRGGVPRSFALKDIARWYPDDGTPPAGYEGQ